jgi:hypothetical protein
MIGLVGAGAAAVLMKSFAEAHLAGRRCWPTSGLIVGTDPAAPQAVRFAELQRIAESVNAWPISGAAFRKTWSAHPRGASVGRGGAQPAGGADVGAQPERRGVQPRRPHPALQQPRAAAVQGLSDAPTAAGGGEIIGLGRSIYWFSSAT